MKIVLHRKLKNIALITLGAVFFCTCKNHNTIKDWEELKTSTKPEIVGKNIEIKHSANGKVQFKAVIPKVIEQQKEDKPYIYICPQGINIWQYDSLTQTNFYLTADSAYIVEPEQYYELWGNVTISRDQDSTYAYTDKIFIEQKKNLIHTNSKVVINKLNQIKDATAEGFRSDLAFERPIFYRITEGEVNYKDLQLRRQKDSVFDKSIAQENLDAR